MIILLTLIPIVSNDTFDYHLLTFSKIIVELYSRRAVFGSRRLFLYPFELVEIK